MHFAIIITIVIIIVVFQFGIYISTLKKIKVFENVFPDKSIASQTKALDREIEEGKIEVEESFELKSRYYLSGNPIFESILSSINSYVEANKGRVSDFYLIKDIVDRNCDSKEEEIQTQIPVPLYLGLVGTMAGILVGILFLWLSGGLNDLLSQGTGDGVRGVEALLGGVALAMISSILGIGLTTWCSLVFKSAKIEFENNKHAYLTTIHTDLLPAMGGDIGTSLERMSKNLQKFNRDFSKNTSDFQTVLTAVNSASANVSSALTAINRLKMTEIAAANIETYSALKNCTDEIGKLGTYLQDVNQYMGDTTDTFDRMQIFLKGWLENIDSININVHNVLARFADNSEIHLKALQEKLDSQIIGVANTTKNQQEVLKNYSESLFTSLTQALTEQQAALVTHHGTVFEEMRSAANEQVEIFGKRMRETTLLVEELKNLSAVKSSIEKLVTQSSIQTNEIYNLTKSINELAALKVTGGVIKQEIPIKQKVALYTCGGVVTSYCLFEIITKVLVLI
jgi:hypothetical protein